MEVRAWGITNIVTDDQLDRQLSRGSDSLVARRLTPTLAFDGASLVVLPALAKLSTNSAEQERATKLLVQRILKHCEGGGKVCLFYAEDFNQYQGVGASLMRVWGLTIQGETPSEPIISAAEFKTYLSEYDYRGFSFKAADAQRAVPQLHPIAESGETRQATAFAVQQGTGLIYVVPANFVQGAEISLLWALADSVEAHCRAILRPETAPIADSFAFTKEAGVRKKRQAKQDELLKIDSTLEVYAERKDILFLRDNPLAERIPEWIAAYLGYRTRRIEEYVEDFWLLDDQDGDAVICEAKGLSENVKRKHIRQLVLHRDERELSDDFPALLVVNTFADAKTEQEKGRQRINSLECRNAVKEHVLIVRTLDLVRLLDHVDEGLVTKQEIWDLLTNETGWLKVEDGQRKTLKD